MSEQTGFKSAHKQTLPILKPLSPEKGLLSISSPDYALATPRLPIILQQAVIKGSAALK
ncbi:hypothetical protein JMY81_08480 [Brenneria goodwinii]|uniref:hypothetical protein n=1 Tax=Brenneria goodwinii TaxID=1109412 RepID=UPI0015FFC45A|nr:hypothetical protein [Brenneria goodwinii]MCG8156391.1 hypothetical protein [Brenneria goodwinii]MCG8160870.1 hypothetical protein [Brenneria goodwinii]MCG8166183.1 hypothetical protein [Brenneria goodwinii]MCG8169707.1 hypothetical protein [Brenneria goodwinii]MCG8175050.1 hypothetical protein [Brenneria goodwinii]